LEKLVAMIPLLGDSGLNSRELLETIGSLAGAAAAAAPHASSEGAAAAAGCGGAVCDNDDMFDRIAVEMSRLIRREAAAVAQHPNASLYQSLQRLVKLEGYYLESQPCLSCTPWAEVPLTMQKLDQLRAEAKFTDRSQLVKLVCAHTIQRFTVTMTDVRRVKLVKTVNLYYYNKPVADINQATKPLPLLTKPLPLLTEPLPLLTVADINQVLSLRAFPSTDVQILTFHRCAAQGQGEPVAQVRAARVRDRPARGNRRARDSHRRHEPNDRVRGVPPGPNVLAFLVQKYKFPGTKSTNTDACVRRRSHTSSPRRRRIWCSACCAPAATAR
jgi:hypothetical protein